MSGETLVIYTVCVVGDLYGLPGLDPKMAKPDLHAMVSTAMKKHSCRIYAVTYATLSHTPST